MKKGLPLILLLLFVAVAVIGVLGVRSAGDTGSFAGSQQPESGISRESVTDKNADLLNVRTPEGLEEQLKDYEGFRVSFNSANHTPNWVAWELLGSETDGPNSRYNKFWQDNDLKGCPTTKDYSNSGYDRGHMCPAADQKWSEQAMIDCFSLANMVPQDNALNTGAWKTLENKERVWAKRDSALVIIAGPIYEAGDTKRIGSAGVRVPSAFFKILAAPWLDKPRGIAFVYPNMSAPGNMENYVMTIRDVEKLTGYDFLHELPDDIENSIETVSSFRDWNRKN